MTDTQMETLTTKVLLYRVAELLRARGFDNAALVAQVLFSEQRAITEDEVRKLTVEERIESHAALLTIGNGLIAFYGELKSVDVTLAARLIANSVNAFEYVALEKVIANLPPAKSNSETVH